jgi:hypothetical protein
MSAEPPSGVKGGKKPWEFAIVQEPSNSSGIVWAQTTDFLDGS